MDKPQITNEEVRALSALARIEMSDEEVSAFQKESTAILGYVSELSKVSAHEGEADMLVVNVLREDAGAHEPGTYTQDILANAPSRDGNHVVVKKIL